MREAWGPPAQGGWPSFCSECGARCVEPPLCEGCEAKLVEFLTFDAEQHEALELTSDDLMRMLAEGRPANLRRAL